MKQLCISLVKELMYVQLHGIRTVYKMSRSQDIPRGVQQPFSEPFPDPLFETMFSLY